VLLRIRRVVLGLLPAPGPAGLRLSRQACGLSDFDQVPMGVADVGTDFAAVILRLGEELCASRRPLCIGRADVGHPDVENALAR
jgi:hypothetical protein